MEQRESDSRSDGGERFRRGEGAALWAETSGYVVVYSPSGELLFHGGITAGRGHAGDNSGEQAILSLLSTHEAPTRQTRVFGCALLDAKTTSAKTASVCSAY